MIDFALFFFFFSSNVWFYHRSLSDLVSGSWLSKQGRVWVLSHGVEQKSNQTLFGYSYSVDQHGPSIVFRQDRIEVKDFVARLVSTFLSVACRIPSCTRETRIKG